MITTQETLARPVSLSNAATAIFVPQVPRWVRTFPAPGAGGPSSDPLWWTVVAVCVAAIAISAGGRGQPRWRARVAIPRLPGAVRP